MSEEKNALRKHYEKHPKFRTYFDLIAAKASTFGLLYWIVSTCFITSIALTIFFKLPDEIRVPVTAIVSTILTTLIIPFTLNRINTKNDRNEKKFERNLPFYSGLAEKIIRVFQENEQHSQLQKIVELANYIADQYPQICINLSARQIDLLFNIKDECHLFFDQDQAAKASINNIYDYAERFFAEARRQGDIKGTVYLNDKMTEKLVMPALGNMQPPAQIPTTQTGDQNEQRTQTAN